MCKLCNKKHKINKIVINNEIYYEYNNLIYNNDNILKYEKYGTLINGKLNIIPFEITIELISLNKIKYYLVNDNMLYKIDNNNIFNNILDNSIGKLLGPKMAIIYEKKDNKKLKKMVIIEKLKYNRWENLE